jgi:hypothetical protein
MLRFCAGNGLRWRPFHTPIDPGPRSSPLLDWKTRRIRSASTGGSMKTGHPTGHPSQPIRPNYSCPACRNQLRWTSDTMIVSGNYQEIFVSEFLFKCILQCAIVYVRSLILNNVWAMDTNNSPERKLNKVCQPGDAPGYACSASI